MDLAGDYFSVAYLSSIQTPANRAFLDLLARRFGKHRVADEAMVAAYLGVHLWALAAQAAGSDAPRLVRQELGKQRFLSPEGEVSIDPGNLHINVPFRLARIENGNQVELVTESKEPLLPVPFPTSRLRLEWEQLLDRMYRGWGGHWVNPAYYRIPGPH